MSSINQSLPSKYTDLKVRVEVKDNKVIVSGRLYIVNHVYLTGFRSASIHIAGVKQEVEVNCIGLPNVVEEGGLLKIASNKGPKEVKKPRVIEVKENSVKEALVENADLRFEVSEDGIINVNIVNIGEYEVSELYVSIEEGEESILNILLTPFTSAWIYCPNIRELIIEKVGPALKVTIGKGSSKNQA
ncbi:MAG: hypothetical protein QW164_05110 [Desulfurococcaceae archaeon]